MKENLSAVLKPVSRSLYLSIKVFPAGLQDVFGAAYLLCRAADTVADTDLLERAARGRLIRLFPRACRANGPERQAILAAAAQAADAQKLQAEKNLLSSLSDCFAAADNLPEQDRAITFEAVDSVCRGMLLDLEYFPPAPEIKAMASASELETYCRDIGGGPGIFWTKAICLHTGLKDMDGELTKQGANIGDALQITNILRDMAQDLRIGRCYLPEEDLKEVKLTAKDLLDPSAYRQLKPVVDKWIRWGAQRLASAESYILALPARELRVRAATIWPVFWSLDTFAQLAAAENLLDPSKRTKIRRSRIYGTIAQTPLILASDTAFIKGYRLRRETIFCGLGSKAA